MMVEVENVSFKYSWCDCTEGGCLGSGGRGRCVMKAIFEAVEACAKIADQHVGADPVATAIRARGQE